MIDYARLIGLVISITTIILIVYYIWKYEDPQ